ncbi:hypothetical protein SAMN05216490_3483 [Mucilaginibacter mallensis]|uniref:Uncharacterized protein n=1 Tax=Mucilaginibacter mallensis TaxID=652787 RepID=A0A1H2ADD3_MUCMA|nr:hypothetical protein SAMN05216490_3483 [Mucilaginibacter mallensis]
MNKFAELHKSKNSINCINILIFSILHKSNIRKIPELFAENLQKNGR